MFVRKGTPSGLPKKGPGMEGHAFGAPKGAGTEAMPSGMPKSRGAEGHAFKYGKKQGN
jgi:hypothetical protein